MALSKDTPRQYAGAGVYKRTAGGTVYAGSCLEIDASGNVVASSGGGQFGGFALDGAASGETLEVLQDGEVWVPLSGTAATDLGDAVYASDDGTFTKTATSNMKIGTIVDVNVTDALVLVRIAEQFGVTT
jgi:predicted RecA/RadA family phage recombinase